MNFFTPISIFTIFAAFACLLLSFFTRMKPYAKRTRFLFLVVAGVALACFMLWGVTRNF